MRGSPAATEGDGDILRAIRFNTPPILHLLRGRGNGRRTLRCNEPRRTTARGAKPALAPPRARSSLGLSRTRSHV